MNATGKKQLIESLSKAIQKWLDDADPNSEIKTDIGYIGEKTVKLMAALSIAALELNSEAQENAVKEGYFKV